MNKAKFQELVWQKGRHLYRDMPWRDSTDPYYVLVSELMLQQTQVDRVIPKFNAFIKQFPTIEALEARPLADVLKVWNGLGYNRRAKYLHDTAKRVIADYEGIVPSTYDDLVSLPGVGPSTAGAILVYSFNQPVIFIETNIRTVYFLHFFKDQDSIRDADLRSIVNNTIDSEHPREFYWALMDYGAYLKKQGTGHINQSAHYKKQSALKGSVREVRGQIIRALTEVDLSGHDLRDMLVADDRFDLALDALIEEGMVTSTDNKIHLTK